MANAETCVDLKEETLLGFSDYIRESEAGMEQTLHGEGTFLWSDGTAERAKEVAEGKAIAQFWSGRRPVKVPDGLIHDWIGAARIASTTVEKVLAVVQDYDNHKNTYRPEVIDSRVLSRKGDDFEIYLRLLKKKIVTVVLDTYHDVQYSSPGSARWCIRSYTTRISEIKNAGQSKEEALPPDTGHGYLWRLYSYWRLEQKDGDVLIQCRAISLSRDVPAALRLITEPIIKKLPKTSLIATLEATRNVLLTIK
jgi:hypothetical protein